jgi:molybdenum cofactor guanylyltransferase
MGSDSPEIGGIVLCGGQSKRMGRPKAWLPVGDELMLQRVVRILGKVVQPIVVVAAPDQPLPPLAKDVIITRDEEKGRGPLQGLAAGFRALPELCRVAYVSSCDVPFLRPAFIRRLIDLLNDHDICVPHVQGYHHPLAAVYRTKVQDTVRQLLAQDRLRPIFLFESAATRYVEAHELTEVDPDLQSLRNLNTFEEYDNALKDLFRN